jgi:hypothetical protein
LSDSAVTKKELTTPWLPDSNAHRARLSLRKRTRLRHMPQWIWIFSDLAGFCNLHGVIRSQGFADYQIYEPLLVGNASSIMDRAMKKIGSALFRAEKHGILNNNSRMQRISCLDRSGNEGDVFHVSGFRNNRLRIFMGFDLRLFIQSHYLRERNFYT